MNFFQVQHPKLEYQPGEIREGLKRYNFHKNMNSYDYPVLSKPEIASVSEVRPNAEINSSVQSPEILRLKKQLLLKQQEIDRLKNLAEGTNPSYNNSPPNSFYQDPSQLRSINRSMRSSYDYNIFDIAKHPAFQQPKFTKRNPKVIQTNPINGYSVTPDKERNLGQYANMVLTSNRSLA